MIAYSVAQPEKQLRMEVKIPFDLGIIRSGDLVFRQGRGIFSGLFRNVGEVPSPYSHVGIIYVEKEDVFVIHSEANDVTGIGFSKKDNLYDFIDPTNALTYGFFRVKGLNANDAQYVLGTALAYVINRTPFDADFNLENDSLYCTELVYKAYKSAGINLVRHPLTIQLPFVKGFIPFRAITVGQLVQSDTIQLVFKTE